jgi:hypothetical protein
MEVWYLKDAQFQDFHPWVTRILRSHKCMPVVNLEVEKSHRAVLLTGQSIEVLAREDCSYFQLTTRGGDTSILDKSCGGRF